jgi:hypothetical protein
MNQKGGAEKILLLRFIRMMPISLEVDEEENNFIHHLVENGDEYTLKEFLSKYVSDGNIDDIINLKNGNGETPLHLAVKNNYQRIAQLLIDFGANKNIKDKNGNIIKWVNEEGDEFLNLRGGGKKRRVIIRGTRKL